MKRSLTCFKPIYTISDLPDDILTDKIIPLLSLTDIPNIARVSRKFKNLTYNANGIWKIHKAFYQTIDVYKEMLNFIKHTDTIRTRYYWGNRMFISIEFRYCQYLYLHLFAYVNSIFIYDIPECNLQKELIHLHNIPTVYIYISSITDVSMLRHCTTVLLYDCNNVTDVSALANVPCIDMEQTSVRDISMLKSQTYLNVSNCPIERLPTMSKLKELVLSRNSLINIADIVYLQQLETIDIHRMNISTFPYCKCLKSITINDCPIIDIQNLAHASFVHLLNCNEMRDVSCLRNVDTLLINKCINIIDVTMLNNKYLNISQNMQITTLGRMSNTTMLNISHTGIESHSGLAHINEIIW